MSNVIHDSRLRAMVTITVMLVTVVEVLDMTIVNVAMPNMMGSLSATSDQITWVLTSYIVAAAIFMPLTGLLVKRIGRKRLLLLNVVMFMVASILCGLAQNLTSMVLFRTLQGIFGASLSPLSQYILRDSFPKEKIGSAMAIWGMGVMAGPILGPTLGGYITHIASWRWIFYLNVPVCMLAMFMTLKYIKDTPVEKVNIDWLGLLLMSVGIGSLQIFLDRGNSADWFASGSIIILAGVAVLTLFYFAIRGWRKKNNIINLHLFKNRNFLVCEILVMVFVSAILATFALQPILMERFLGFPVLLTGLLAAPRGIASMIAMMLVGRLLGKKVSPRLILFVGLAIGITGTYLLSTFAPSTSHRYIILVGMLQGFGLGCFFVPVSTLAFATLNTTDLAEASGLFSFGRSLGNSIGISILSTVITRQTQVNWTTLAAHLTPTNPNLLHWLSVHHWTLHSPEALFSLKNTIMHQAGLLAFLQVFCFVALFLLFILPLAGILKNPD